MEELGIRELKNYLIKVAKTPNLVHSKFLQLVKLQIFSLIKLGEIDLKYAILVWDKLG